METKGTPLYLRQTRVTKLCLRHREYNTARVLDALHDMIVRRGGYIVQTNHDFRDVFPRDLYEIADRYFDDGETVVVRHHSSIQFVLKERYFSFQIDDNMFRPGLVSKNPVVSIKGQPHFMNCYGEHLSDDVWMSEAMDLRPLTEEEIKGRATVLYNVLLAHPGTEYAYDEEVRRVQNTYNNGTHIEKVQILRTIPIFVLEE